MAVTDSGIGRSRIPDMMKSTDCLSEGRPDVSVLHTPQIGTSRLNPPFDVDFTLESENELLFVFSLFFRGVASSASMCKSNPSPHWLSVLGALGIRPSVSSPSPSSRLISNMLTPELMLKPYMFSSWCDIAMHLRLRLVNSDSTETYQYIDQISHYVKIRKVMRQ